MSKVKLNPEHYEVSDEELDEAYEFAKKIVNELHTMRVRRLFDEHSD